MSDMLKKIMWVVMAWMCLQTSFAATTTSADAPLAMEQAFQFSTMTRDPNTVIITLHIAPGYYLYAEKTSIAWMPAISANIRYPKGIAKHNDVVGNYIAYTGTVSIPIVFQSNPSDVQLNVHYQGCSEAGFCYPPSEKIMSISNAASKLSLSSLMTNQNDVASLFANMNASVLFLIFLGLGLLLAFTPCVLPMIPILTGIILGQHHKVGTRESFFLSLSYVLGMAIMYSFAGLLAASLGSSIQVWLQQPWVVGAMSVILLLLAFSLFGFYDFRFPRRWQKKVFDWSDKHERGTYVGVFFMGVLSTLVVSPCITAPLIGVLIYISQTGNQLLGAGALFSMGLGMGIPLILIGMSAGKWLPKSGAWMKSIKATFGLLMIAMAIWMFARVLPTESNQQFTLIHTVSEFHQQMDKAKQEKRPVILDFYADWCASCVSMDRKVFNNMAIRQVLARYLLLRVDLTNNDAADQAMMKYFNVIAPPSILFFNADGQEDNAHRVVGELDASLFLARLKLLKQ